MPRPAASDAASPDELAAELQRATEDEAGFAEQLEARLALVDASTRVEALAASRVMRVASQLAATEAGQTAQPVEPPRPALDADYADRRRRGSVPAGGDRVLPPGPPGRGAGGVVLRLGAPRRRRRPRRARARVVRSLLDKLERMSEAVQIIYLSDDPDIADWVASVGIQRAAVVAAPRQFA